MNKVLITGATGFIGSHLVEKNLKEGNHVRILALPDDPVAREYETRGIEVIYGDIRDNNRVELSVKGVDIVFHLAAVVTDWAPKELFVQVNIHGTRNVCEASLRNKVDRLVEVSTNDVFGIKEDVIIDETFDYDYWREPYADTKLEATKIHIPYWTAYTVSCLMEYTWKSLRKKSRPLLTKYTVKNLGSRLKYSIEKAERLLDWVPPISYEVGFNKTMEWLKKTDPALWKQK